MIALIQRVSEARIDIGCKTVANIGRGLVIFLAIESDDNGRVCKNSAGRWPDTEYSRMRTANSI